MRSKFSRVSYLGKAAKLSLLVVMVAMLSWPHLTSAVDQTVVTIFVDGEKKVVSTSAETVGEVLERTNITMDSEDLVEPAPETPFTTEIFNINVYRSRPVIVVDGPREILVNTAYQSPKLIAERSAKLEVFPEDEYQTELIRDFVNAGTLGTKILIKRAAPLTLRVDGAVLPLRTQASTIVAMLKEKGITLSPEDQLNLPANHPITPGLEVIIARVGRQVVAQEEIVAAPVEAVYDNNRPVGSDEVRQAGKSGRQLVTYEIRSNNGVEVERVVLQTVAIESPIPRVVIRGNRTATRDANWAGLRQCESGGNYQNRSNPSYRGAYQFSYSTWSAVGGNGDPADAPPAEQDMRAQILYQRSGGNQWPSCGPKYLP